MLTPEDHRGLTPLFWSHVLPYGEVKLNMASRLTLRARLTSAPQAVSGGDGQADTAHTPMIKAGVRAAMITRVE